MQAQQRRHLNEEIKKTARIQRAEDASQQDKDNAFLDLEAQFNETGFPLGGTNPDLEALTQLVNNVTGLSADEEIDDEFIDIFLNRFQEEEEEEQSRPAVRKSKSTGTYGWDTIDTVEAYYRVLTKLVYYSNSSPSSFVNSVSYMKNFGPQFEEPVDIALTRIQGLAKIHKPNPTVRKYIAQAAYLVLDAVKNVPGSEHFGARELYFIRLDSASFIREEKIKAKEDERKKKAEEAKKTVEKSISLVLVSTSSVPQKSLLENGTFGSEAELKRVKAVYTIPFRLPNKAAVKRYTDFVEELNRRIDAFEKLLALRAADEGIAYAPKNVPKAVTPIFLQIKTTKGVTTVYPTPEIIVTKETLAGLIDARSRILSNIAETFEASRKANTKPDTTFEMKSKNVSAGVNSPTVFLKPFVDWVNSGDLDLRVAIERVQEANVDNPKRSDILDELRNFSQGDSEEVNNAESALELGIGKTRTAVNLMSYALSHGNHFYRTDTDSIKFKAEGEFLNTLLGGELSLGHSRDGTKRVPLETPSTVLNIVKLRIKNKSRHDYERGIERSAAAESKSAFDPESFVITELSVINGVISLNTKNAVHYGDAIAHPNAYKNFSKISSKAIKEGDEKISTDNVKFGNVTAAEIREFLENEFTALDKLSKQETLRRKSLKKAK